ncbi:MAG TPA: hypothetical protein VF069_14630 [Streptosporangiaceae bacterium]
MLVVFGVALLVLAAAVVVLFAMLAELAARIPDRSTPYRNPAIRALGEARVGNSPDTWPVELPQRDRSVVLVLSTICNACEDVARQLTTDPGHTDWAEMSLVISTAARIRGEEFIVRNRLGEFPYFIDEGGEWVHGEFGVQSSPTALVFRGSRLESAHEFNDVAALRAALAQGPQVMANGELHREKEEV